MDRRAPAPKVRRMIRIILALLLFVASPAVLSDAWAAAAPVALSDADKAFLARVETYLSSIVSMDARFLQVANGRMAEGRVVMARPGRMRIDYDPPVPVRMVANGSWVLYFDIKLNQISYIPASRTPLAVLLREQVRLDDKVTVTKVERVAGAARVSLVLTDNPESGTLTVVFEDAPLRLVKWEVLDSTGTRVEVALLDPHFGLPVDNNLFDMVDPRAKVDRE
ncbi:MAG: outer membrane lipoprotein carrier protein LolA [Alphaproteobacteria bacterium]|nr:outer membrane lipoprotein carrier protein LolA [Alphaproteobacteria bacterium]